MGSPPHTRGPSVEDDLRSRRAGIIPAYAGTTPCGGPVGPRRRDHPRIRGDHQQDQVQLQTNAGSPPHTRGPQHAVVLEGVLVGITPAYAGTTSDGPSVYAKRWDHPRIRGDHLHEQTKHTDWWGSLPHTRGPPMSILAQLTIAGITPAYAGTTSTTSRRSDLRGDHPRIRGVHLGGAVFHVVTHGSPPHTRGPDRSLRLSRCDVPPQIAPVSTVRRSSRQEGRRATIHKRQQNHSGRTL